ncbi:leucine carboxy methyltransferase [Starmerella bacillaris]|uniref:Leucine carboxyl methyltransferase 1 n=1 Tax=Starmerella bacillaris TaxID=1247836 RepID=A0AAV5RKY1_STABA|nr:leucine carboxy methyltransferase [Starmerella bacillaris]
MSKHLIRQTDDDAAGSRLSCLKKKYYEDKFLNLFIQRARPRLPLINIGTYCRIKAVNECIQDFISKNREACAIVSLGAGSDTTPFHLLPTHVNLDYYEIDFEESVAAKQKVIDSNEELTRIVSESNGRYHLYGMDLRKINDERYNYHYDLNKPTLLISECCLCYLKPQEADEILQFFINKAPKTSVVVYEPLYLDDSFGRVMSENFAMRGISMPTVEAYPDLVSQVKRFEHYGFNKVIAKSLFTYYNELDKDDKERISRLEFLDELEEMILLLSHYGIIYAY